MYFAHIGAVNNFIISYTGHYAKVAAEPRVQALKKSKSRLSFRRRKKDGSRKLENKNSNELEKSQESIAGMERIANCLNSEKNNLVYSRYEAVDLMKVNP